MDDEIAKEIFEGITAKKSDISSDGEGAGMQLGLFDEE
jgi:hypothetical protein